MWIKRSLDIVKRSKHLDNHVHDSGYSTMKLLLKHDLLTVVAICCAHEDLALRILKPMYILMAYQVWSENIEFKLEFNFLMI